MYAHIYSAYIYAYVYTYVHKAYMYAHTCIVMSVFGVYSTQPIMAEVQENNQR